MLRGFDIPCTKCGAKKGERCRSRSGRVYASSIWHRARLDALEKKRKESLEYKKQTRSPGGLFWVWAAYERTNIPYITSPVHGIEVRLQCWPALKKDQPPRFRWDVAPGTETSSFGYTQKIDDAFNRASVIALHESMRRDANT